MKKPRVRFAPSPTGELHVGNARTALFNWLFARHHEGVFVLRIEDTDRERSLTIYEGRLLSALTWLGLDWDEGPDRGGPFGPYRQSERIHLYREFLGQLEKKGLVYPCYCTEEELEAERKSLLARGFMPRYMGKCRSLTREERNKMEAQGRKPAWRFKVSPGPIHFTDLIRGPMHFMGETIGDFIVFRSNGLPAYNFACVIDDHLMEITHVIRGEDHLTNTASQILLYRALDFACPLFAHHALILGPDRSKLSKRHGSVTVEGFRLKGILPQALVNYLALLGAALEGEGEISSLSELVARFSIERAAKGGAIFDERKLLWLNALYLRNEPWEKIEPYLRDVVREKQVDGATLKAVFELVRHNISTLNDVAHFLDLFGQEAFEPSSEAKRVLSQERAKHIIRLAIDEIRNLPSEGEHLFERLYAALKDKTGLSGKEILMPLRAAIMGETAGPELKRVFSFLGKERVLARLMRTSS
ncbi:MAG TPA: glutamate--tRNA ligase [Syntrophales bacterium]|nr:glutamate--tRNA ligase [Syntrophales bacterium]HOL58681.1 glutamate--tRNA ligase [Syntrophales bacterium]HPO35031.1 glutamate--tRNA ligase [Syntrophales bacterium]